MSKQYSIKMVDGSRYETDKEPIRSHFFGGDWFIFETGEKTKILNMNHIASITITEVEE